MAVGGAQGLQLFEPGQLAHVDLGGQLSADRVGQGLAGLEVSAGQRPRARERLARSLPEQGVQASAHRRGAPRRRSRGSDGCCYPVAPRFSIISRKPRPPSRGQAKCPRSSSPFSSPASSRLSARTRRPGSRTRCATLAAERGAVILAHNYQVPEVQDVADFVGDSLGALAPGGGGRRQTIAFCGVHFMAETAASSRPRRPCCCPTWTPAARWPTRSPPTSCAPGRPSTRAPWWSCT